MNIRQKFTVAALLTGFALVSNPAKADVLGFSVGVPEIAAVTAEIGKTIATDLTAYLRNAVSTPRATRTRHSPTVSVHELGAVTIETVTVVATRLPPLATESFAQDTTRTAQAASHIRL